MSATLDPSVFAEAWLQYQALSAFVENLIDRREALQDELTAALQAVEAAILPAQAEQAHMAETLRDPRAPEHYRTMHNEASLRGVIKTARELVDAARTFLTAP